MKMKMIMMMGLAIMAVIYSEQITGVVSQDCGTDVVALQAICTDITTASGLATCCDGLSIVADTDRTCFCLILASGEQDPTFTTDVSEILTVCAIDGTFETLCPSFVVPPPSP